MRAIRVAAAALLAAPLAATALALAAPAALAEDGDGPNDGTGHPITSFGFSVTPQTVAPGGTVTLKADGCEVPSVTVESGVFDTVTLTEGRQGTATVDLDAKTGAEYEVAFDCKGERGTAKLTVSGGGHENAGHENAGHENGGSTGAHKGVKAGFGTAAGAEGPAGIGVTEAVTGAVLIVGALGAAVVLIRRRDTSGT
ncbi:hypothetical protein [Streptomyces sp. NBC_01268]|uniref:hypothetical protein n=1 Tax=Streptomyces sp. NBC_01268 TaxID=2903806 RepID=UPI002E369292|nr:hypothetical protein [Streptomyces sp. NBC_01268]